MQTWEVVGGKRDGVVVRTGRELSSNEAVGGRLAFGSIVLELELKGDRLHFWRLSGSGPVMGWASLKMKGSHLLVKRESNLPQLGSHGNKLHVLCCSVCESGHMLPTLRIARALAKRDRFWKVTYVTNAFGARTVQKWLRDQPDETGKIQLESFEDGTDQALVDLAHQYAQEEDGSYLGKINDNISAHCKECLAPLMSGDDRVSCCLVDMASSGFNEVLDSFGVPKLMSCPVSCMAMSILDSNPEVTDAHRAQDIVADASRAEAPTGAKEEVAEAKAAEQGQGRSAPQGPREVPVDLPVFLMLHCFELPPLLSPMMAPLPQHIFPCGLILDEGKNELPPRVRDFIECKGAPPVLYVSMGSQAYFTAEQLQRFLEGLKSPEWRVLWSLRQTQQDLLPGVFDSLGDSFLVMTWCPQLDILRHIKVSAFLSHCGWGACGEAFSTGTPVVAFPMFADQPLNALFLEMCGMARTVAKEPLSMLEPASFGRRLQSLGAVRTGEEKPLREVFTAEKLRESVREVVVNRQYKIAANGMKSWAKSNGGAHRAVEAVEGFCSGASVQRWLWGTQPPEA